MERINIIGGGLAGCEAAWQIAMRGQKARLFEMRPHRMTAAHRTDLLAELVCSNSLKSESITNAVGLLKQELLRLNSLIMKAAFMTRVPAGSALAVDRSEFARAITDQIISHPNIELIREELTSLPGQELTIISSGPLTSPGLCSELRRLTGSDQLYFYDAISPIVDAESVDSGKVFWASRYGKGEGSDYLNCPLTKEDYNRFYDGLMAGQKVPLREFEKDFFFEGCLPIEEMAGRGRDVLLFGPLKPVGLCHPATGETFPAIVQLRKENVQGTMLNMVGFQTRLIHSEQERIFRMIPGLERAEFLRYGSLHRNTYIKSPSLLNKTLQLKEHPHVLIAGQLSGVEGYLESTAMGLVAGINAVRLLRGEEPVTAPPETLTGSLIQFICSSDSASFQPMNSNFGLLPVLTKKIKNKGEKRALLAARSLETLELWRETIG